jgi:hypothetical protein
VLLPFAHSWPIRCAKCGHTGTVIAATADLAAKPLRCRSCGHRQPFAPETIVCARRRPTGRGAAAPRADGSPRSLSAFGVAFALSPAKSVMAFSSFASLWRRKRVERLAAEPRAVSGSSNVP